MLEDQISVVQARIAELERLKSSTAQRRASSSTLHHRPGLGNLLNQFYMQQTSVSAEASASEGPSIELPFIILQALAHNFLHHAPKFGFFLDTQAFHDAVTSRTAAIAPNLPAVLVNVMYLWGVHLSEDPRLAAYEPALLSHALRSTAGSLVGTHPRTVLHSLQASVLLAYYFVRNTRFLEAKYHTSAAVSIAVSVGLHRVRGPGQQEGVGVLLPPRDAKEEGERIAAFWSVLTLNNCWVGLDDAPSNLVYGPGGLKIDTPWPVDTADYIERPHLLPTQSSGTVSKFLANVPDDARSVPALYAKGAILFEEGMRLGVRYRRNALPPPDPEFHALDNNIAAFTYMLPPLACKTLLVVHMLPHGAMIQLHRHFATAHAPSRAKVLAAARAVEDALTKIDVPNVKLVNPVLAPLWTSACLVLIEEMKRQDKQRGVSGTEDLALEAALGSITAAMAVCAPHCRLMTVQLDVVRAHKAQSA
ncbi:hypothetical protein B0H15DRAFT_945761 [Mycena belliarum]|uniref:Transcription factor domain-containing protein n=1 Tax=Mycena belliarum TaxID=1033014 RepID=A0AAD6UB91_9AGAR|nr:hypothetical protein B0H15DRAFT_945761 [Mycena belliae]